MKKFAFIFCLAILTLPLLAAPKPKGLLFDASKGQQRTLAMPDGQQISFTAYEGLTYVANVEDPVYQTLNIFIPDGATQLTPIFLRTYVGGYMESAAGQPQASDATGRALQEGYVVVIPGTRGRHSQSKAIKTDRKDGLQRGRKGYTGRAPKALLDLKAAIRYLRHFDTQMLGNAERIVIDGTSAGGALAALIGASANNPRYEPLLKEMGAAACRDDVFAVVSFCPITDLDHADMAYEWLFNETRARQNAAADLLAVSNELKKIYPPYLKKLALRTADSTILTADNYLSYLKQLLIRSAQMAMDAGADIPDSIGFVFSQPAVAAMPPVNGQPQPSNPPADKKKSKKPATKKSKTDKVETPQPLAKPTPHVQPPQAGKGRGDRIIDLDLGRFLDYVALRQPLKTAPAFDTKGVLAQQPSAENEEFGDGKGNARNFTTFSCEKTATLLTPEMAENVALMNPMNFIGDDISTVTPHWYIRQGTLDRDIAFPVAVNLALKLQNTGKDVNFLLAWNRGHSGDYALDDLFHWLNNVLHHNH